ncbi:MAG: EI24 domain-containing protein [Alphaproteobacteria bacterium]|nr:EI24 domain-containing protein [Alphaproteobacteria bacterium]
MLSPFVKAAHQLPEPAFRNVLLKSLALAVVLYGALLWLAFYIVPPLISFEWSWLEWLTEAGALLAFLVAAFILFPTVATLFVSLFLEEIASAVEERHYPDDAPGQSPDVWTSFALSLRFTVVALLINVLALPIYLITLFLPPLNLVVFYGLNGYLLSREYFELVSSRHLAPEAMRELRRSEWRRLFVMGVIIAFLLTVPLVNFVAPVLATAAMVHGLKGLQARRSA